MDNKAFDIIDARYNHEDYISLLTPSQVVLLNYLSLKFIWVIFKNPFSTLQKDIFQLCQEDQIINIV